MHNWEEIREAPFGSVAEIERTLRARRKADRDASRMALIRLNTSTQRERDRYRIARDFTGQCKLVRISPSGNVRFHRTNAFERPGPGLTLLPVECGTPYSLICEFRNERMHASVESVRESIKALDSPDPPAMLTP